MGLASKLLDVNYHEISLSLESGSSKNFFGRVVDPAVRDIILEKLKNQNISHIVQKGKKYSNSNIFSLKKGLQGGASPA